MSRKHYVALANALKRWSEDAFRQWERDCNQVAGVLARDNVAFDNERFLAACGVI